MSDDEFEPVMESPHSATEWPPEYDEKWRLLVDGVNEVLSRLFPGDDEEVHFVIGAQWGEMGKNADADLLPCIVGSNVHICGMRHAVEEMAEFVHREHVLSHGGPDPKAEVTEEVPIENLPEDVRHEVEHLMEALGLPPEMVKVVGYANMGDPDADLAALTDDDPDAQF